MDIPPGRARSSCGRKAPSGADNSPGANSESPPLPHYLEPQDESPPLSSLCFSEPNPFSALHSNDYTTTDGEDTVASAALKLAESPLKRRSLPLIFEAADDCDSGISDQLNVESSTSSSSALSASVSASASASSSSSLFAQPRPFPPPPTTWALRATTAASKHSSFSESSQSSRPFSNDFPPSQVEPRKWREAEDIIPSSYYSDTADKGVTFALSYSTDPEASEASKTAQKASPPVHLDLASPRMTEVVEDEADVFLESPSSNLHRISSAGSFQQDGEEGDTESGRLNDPYRMLERSQSDASLLRKDLELLADDNEVHLTAAESGSSHNISECNRVYLDLSRAEAFERVELGETAGTMMRTSSGRLLETIPQEEELKTGDLSYVYASHRSFSADSSSSLEDLTTFGTKPKSKDSGKYKGGGGKGCSDNSNNNNN
ncbi:cell wall protein RBR3, partial [Aplysia californica]|uniref:Cell wall protein RBR3 n=1 Tax=Aplysia californica TaxID=6500 RepID=A0ABM1A3X0_APLCA